MIPMSYKGKDRIENSSLPKGAFHTAASSRLGKVLVSLHVASVFEVCWDRLDSAEGDGGLRKCRMNYGIPSHNNIDGAFQRGSASVHG